MRYLILKGYELVTVLLPFIVVFAVLTKKGRQKGGLDSLRHFLMVCVFAAYIFATFYFTRVGTVFGLFRYGRELHNGQINLLPFTHDIDITAYLLNILLFVPLGFLLPLIWPNTGKLKYVLLSGLSFSLLIEISQLLSHRATDVDDLIMNTAGAVLGYLLYKLFARITKWSNRRLGYLKYEPLIYIGAMFLGRFLLYDDLGLARMLFGF